MPENLASYVIEMFNILEGANWRVFRHFILDGFKRVDRRYGNRFQKKVFALNGQYLKQ